MVVVVLEDGSMGEEQAVSKGLRRLGGRRMGAVVMSLGCQRDGLEKVRKQERERRARLNGPAARRRGGGRVEAAGMEVELRVWRVWARRAASRQAVVTGVVVRTR